MFLWIKFDPGRKISGTQRPVLDNSQLEMVHQANTNAGNNNGLSVSHHSDSSSGGSTNPSLSSEPSVENEEEFDDWVSGEFTDSEDELLDRDTEVSERFLTFFFIPLIQLVFFGTYLV